MINSENTSTEWYIQLDEPAAQNVRAAVVYHTTSQLDENGEPSGISRLWVAARGYEGGGVISAFSAVASFDDSFDLEDLASCQVAFPESEDFELSDDGSVVNSSDLDVLKMIWAKVDELTHYDLEAEDPLVTKISAEDDNDFVSSEGWDPYDLLEPVVEQWQFLLEF
jgi:hypothetical protein